LAELGGAIKTSRMFVWSKLSPAKWLDAWEDRFHGNPNFVLRQARSPTNEPHEPAVICDWPGVSLRHQIIEEKCAGRIRRYVAMGAIAFHAVAFAPS